jgi:hypothetical protein
VRFVPKLGHWPRLCVGQRATVLQLPAVARSETREKHATVEAF